MSDEIVLSDYDVVSIATDKNFANVPTCKVSEIKQAMIQQFLGDKFSSWIKEGVNAEALLESGGGWQKGKIRLRMEFIPDEPSEASEASEPPLQRGIRIVLQ